VPGQFQPARVTNIAKGEADAETLVNNMPPEYKGYEVWIQEGWYDGGTVFSKPRKYR
jgi:hypothetical protein